MKTNILVFLFVILFLPITSAQHKTVSLGFFLGAGGKGMKSITEDKSMDSELFVGADIEKKISKKKWSSNKLSVMTRPYLMYAKYNEGMSSYNGSHLFLPLGLRYSFTPGHEKDGFGSLSLAVGVNNRYTISSRLKDSFYSINTSYSIDDITHFDIVYKYDGNPFKKNPFSQYLFLEFRFLEYSTMKSNKFYMALSTNINLGSNEVTNFPEQLIDPNLGSIFFYNYNTKPFGQWLFCIGYSL